MTEFGRQFLAGRAAGNLVAKTINQGVKLHLDGGDGPMSVICWLHGGAGEVEGGHFCVPELGIKLLPLDCTLVVMATGALYHGTTEPKVVGSTQRVGMSLFLRPEDVKCWAALTHAAGGRKQLAQIHGSWVSELQATAKDQQEAVRKASAQARAALMEEGKCQECPSSFKDSVWKPPNAQGPLMEVNIFNWVA